MSIKIVETLNSYCKDLEYAGHLSKMGITTYIKDQLISVRFYKDQLVITDLSNALKAGRNEVKSFIYNNGNLDTETIYFEFTNFMQTHGLDTRNFFSGFNSTTTLETMPKFTDEDGVEKNKMIHITKSMRVFSPFPTFKKVNSNTTWNILKVVKGIVNKQIIAGEQLKICLTSDSKLDLLELAKELTENPSGWYVREDEENSTNKQTVLRVNCFTVESNILVFQK